MKKEYAILGLMLFLILIGLWFFFFRGDSTKNQRLETPVLGTNNLALADSSMTPDNLEDYNEILVKNKGNMVAFYIGEKIAGVDYAYTVSSDEESEVLVSTGIIKVLRPFDVVRLWKKELKSGGATLMAIVLKDDNEVTLSARSSAIAMVIESLSGENLKTRETVISKIKLHPKTTELEKMILKNILKSDTISPMDMNTYPELSPIVSTIKNDILK